MMALRVGTKRLDRDSPDPPSGCVDDPQEVHVIIRIGQQAHIGDHILDLLTGEEALSTGDGVGYLLLKEGLLEGREQTVGSHEDTEIDIGEPVREAEFLDLGADELCLLLIILRMVQYDGPAVLGPGPQILLLPFGVVGDQRVRRMQDVPGRAVVLLEFDLCDLGEIPFEIDQILVVCALRSR